MDIQRAICAKLHIVRTSRELSVEIHKKHGNLVMDGYESMPVWNRTQAQILTSTDPVPNFHAFHA